MFTELGHHHHQFQNILITSKKETHTLCCQPPLLPFPPTLGNYPPKFTLFLDSFAFSNISKNGIIECIVFHIIIEYTCFLYSRTILLSLYIVFSGFIHVTEHVSPSFILLLNNVVSWIYTCGSFPPFYSYDLCCYEHQYTSGHLFSFLRYIPRSGTAVSNGNSTLNFLRNHQIVFQSAIPLYISTSST